MIAFVYISPIHTAQCVKYLSIYPTNRVRSISIIKYMIKDGAISAIRHPRDSLLLTCHPSHSLSTLQQNISISVFNLLAGLLYRQYKIHCNEMLERVTFALTTRPDMRFAYGPCQFFLCAQFKQILSILAIQDWEEINEKRKWWKIKYFVKISGGREIRKSWKLTSMGKCLRRWSIRSGVAHISIVGQNHSVRL